MNSNKIDIADLTDEHLIKAILDQSSNAQQAQAEIYRRYSQNLFVFFRVKGFTKEEAEDSMHQVFIKFFTSVDKFKGQSKLKTYLYSISKNYYIDIIKSSRNQTTRSSDNIELIIDQLNSSHETGESTIANEEAQKCIRECFRSFAIDNRECAEIVTLAVLEDMPLDQVAEWMGKTYAAARKYLSNCRKKLRDVMQPCHEMFAH